MVQVNEEYNCIAIMYGDSKSLLLNVGKYIIEMGSTFGRRYNKKTIMSFNQLA